MKIALFLLAALIAALSLSGCDNKGKGDAESVPPAIETVGTPINENEIGIPFYPGAKANDSVSTKLASSLGNAVSVKLESADPVEKVASFYREKLKAIATDKEFVETSTGEGQISLILADEKNKDSTLVDIDKTASGCDINIVVTQSKK